MVFVTYFTPSFLIECGFRFSTKPGRPFHKYWNVKAFLSIASREVAARTEAKFVFLRQTCRIPVASHTTRGIFEVLSAIPFRLCHRITKLTQL